MKKTTLLLLMTVFVHGYDAEVKKADVTLLVNDKSMTHKAGEKFTLQAGDIVCFDGGKGRVVITGPGYKKQISRHTKGCKHLPGDVKEQGKFPKQMAHKIVALFSKAEEEKVAGVSRKGAETDTVTMPISLKEGDRYLLIENDTWGPLPVTLEILDEKGNVVEKMVNEEDIVSSFTLPRGMVKEGYVINVLNAFDEVLVKSTIHMGKKQ